MDKKKLLIIGIAAYALYRMTRPKPTEQTQEAAQDLTLAIMQNPIADAAVAAVRAAQPSSGNPELDAHAAACSCATGDDCGC